jgi:prepilin-type processing-associated H-X9-DG protein
MFRRGRGAVVWTLIVAMGLSPTMVYAQSPDAAALKAARPKLDLGYVTPETFAAVLAYPRHVLAAPEMEMLPTEVITAGGKKALGIDPMEIEQVLAVAELQTLPQPPLVAAVVKTAAALPQGKIFSELWDRTQEAQLDGKPYRQGLGPTDMSIFRADDHTLLIGQDPMIRKILANHAAPKEAKMTQVLGRIVAPADLRAVVLVEPLRPLLGPAMLMAPVPPPFDEAKRIPDLLNSVAVKVNLTGTTHTALMLRANDEAAAQQLEGIINRLIDSGRQEFLKQIAKEQAAKPSKGDDAVEQAMAKYMERLSGRLLDSLRPKRNGAALTLSSEGSSNGQLQATATIGILVGLLLPAVQAAREAARRAQSANNLKQIALAMAAYENGKRSYPARAIFDKQGKPLLSWRVELLPYLDRPDLHDEFHLDEPWDSPHNRELIPKMPAVFANPSSWRPGMANYRAVCGKGLAFDGTTGRKVAEFRDGLSRTITVVETEAGVEWTKPDDWQPDPKQPLAGLGNAHPGGFNAAFADGHVQFIRNTIDAKVFWTLLTIADGQAVTLPGD